MSTWRKRFSRKSRRLSENNEIFLNNTLKYRKKLQTTIIQINRTKKFNQRNIENPDSQIQIARLINDIGQLSDHKSLQEIGNLIDSLAMRYQLSSRMFNEYSMNSLEQSLEKLNNNLLNDFDQTKSVFEEAITNHCSDHTKRQLFNKVENEWSKHQKLAVKELKHSLSSYCNIGLYNLKIQMTILEKLQDFLDEIPLDGDDGLPNFSINSQKTKKDIDTMLRIMLDKAPNESTTLPNPKRPRFINSQCTSQITEAAASSHQQQTTEGVEQHPISSATASHESIMVTPDELHNSNSLPSYTDLFVVPSSCKEARIQRRSPRFTNQ